MAVRLARVGVTTGIGHAPDEDRRTLVMRRSLIVALAGFALLMVAVGPVLAQPYPPEAPAVTVSETTVVAGQPLDVNGDGWLPDSEVTFTFFSVPVVLGTSRVNANGAFTSQVTIPADATPGPHTLQTSGLNRAGVATNVNLVLNVVAAAPASTARPPSGAAVTPSPRTLPRSGGEAFVALLAAAGLMAVGSAAVVVARRRSHADFGA